MRKDLLCRAKRYNWHDLPTEQWWAQGYTMKDDHTGRIFIRGGASQIIKVDPMTICECIGLSDKNGTIVWEHDIVRHESNDGFVVGELILRDNGYNSFCIRVDEPDGTTAYYPFGSGMPNENRNQNTTDEVIGNIFDTPELLYAENKIQNTDMAVLLKQNILFRAKRKNWKSLPKKYWWVEGSCITDELGANVQPKVYIGYLSGVSNGIVHNYGIVEVEAETVCRYTGQHDKNGVKIWEKDIVDGCKARGAAFHRAVVLWNNWKARFDVRAMGCDFPMILDKCVDDIEITGSDYEVVGNAFDDLDMIR